MFPQGPWDFKTKQFEEAFWVRIEDENERRLRERICQRSSAQPTKPSHDKFSDPGTGR